MDIRYKSLNKNTQICRDLAEIGVCRDRWDANKASCYMCDLIFDEKQIQEIANRERLNYKDAGLLFHAMNKPGCKIIQSLSEEDRKKILGKVYLYKGQLHIFML